MYRALEALCKEKKMSFFLPAPYIDYRVCKLTEGTDWYVTYYVKDPATSKLRRIRVKVNHLGATPRERRREARQLMSAIDARLAIGWNPLVLEQAPNGGEKIGKALDTFLAVKTKELEEGSMRVYRSFVKFLRGWLPGGGLGEESYVMSFTRAHALKIMEYIENDAGLGARSYNNYLSFFFSLFAWFVERGYLSENPFAGIAKKSKRVVGKKKRRILTEAELAQLWKFLGETNPRYRLIAMFCWCCLMRPNEISGLRPEDIDIGKRLVHVRAETAKNDNDSFRTIPDVLAKLLQGIDLGKPGEYVFAKHAGWDFGPGPEQCCSRKFAKFWDTAVRPGCGFGMDVQFYSLKDTGITGMLDSGMALTAVQHQADHSSPVMTAVYVQDSHRAADELRDFGGGILPNS